jgi:hypothetical protein
MQRKGQHMNTYIRDQRMTDQAHNKEVRGAIYEN